MAHPMCELCRKRIATYHVTEIGPNNEKITKDYCEFCYPKAHIKVKLTDPSLQEILSSLIEAHTSETSKAMANLVCPACGISFLDFRATGRLGCPHDYEVFKEGLMPIISRIHQGTRHRGKVPATASREVRLEGELMRLRQRLDEAVQTEDYEEAAKVRDRIAALQREKAHADS